MSSEGWSPRCGTVDVVVAGRVRRVCHRDVGLGLWCQRDRSRLLLGVLPLVKELVVRLVEEVLPLVLAPACQVSRSAGLVVEVLASGTAGAALASKGVSPLMTPGDLGLGLGLTGGGSTHSG